MAGEPDWESVKFRITPAQAMVWAAYWKIELGMPSRADNYVMALRADVIDLRKTVESIFAKEGTPPPTPTQPKDCLLKFDFRTEAEKARDKEEADRKEREDPLSVSNQLYAIRMSVLMRGLDVPMPPAE